MFMNITKKIELFAAVLLLAFFVFSDSATAQIYLQNIKRDSARSDKRTGGKIEKTALVSGDADIKITVNVPSFQLTLWQNGKEVKTYPIGIGTEDFPIVIGLREASQIVWNPDWIPPSSSWIAESSKVKAGEIIKASDPRNPLGKVKIPLGGGYLIHQAKGVGDLGNLVSHGCVRVLQSDLYDLSEKIVAARSLPVSQEQIRLAKNTKTTLVTELDPALPVEITYDTQVIEGGLLRIYPDVYGYRTKSVKNLREELESNGINHSQLTDKTLEQMLEQATAKKQFVVSVANLKIGRALSAGRAIPVLSAPAAKKSGTARRAKA